MGGTYWSDDHYNEKEEVRKATGKSAFAYNAAMASAPASARKAHDSLSPKGVKVRESRDSTAHPNSNAVGVLFDVTGSMGAVPRTLQQNLPKLMALLLRKSYLPDPAILCGAIGDATCDKVPLQIGQFESGIEIENDLTNIFLEGGGGGQQTESYELAMYFMARHTAIDCFEKRNKRGYLFLIGDEMPYSHVKASEVESVIGDKLEGNITTADIVTELKKMYDVYYVLPRMTTNYDDPKIADAWKKLLGQSFLRLEEPEGICELIASTIGVAEGIVDISGLEKDLHEFGTTPALIRGVSDALVPVAKAAGGAKGTEIAVAGSGAASGIARL